MNGQPAQTNPRAGRYLAWLAIAALIVGLTAFYQTMMPGAGGLVESTGQGGNAMIVLERDRSGLENPHWPGLGSEALLGMSFLRHYSIRQQGDRLVIESAT